MTINSKVKLEYKRTKYSLKLLEKGDKTIKCNLYGPLIENKNFYISNLDFEKIEQKEGDAIKNAEYIISIDKKEYSAIIKEIQRHPLKHNIIHLDFYVYSDKVFKCEVPTVVINKNKPTKMHKYTYLYEKKNIKISVANKKIPYMIAIDYTQLKNSEKVKYIDEKGQSHLLLQVSK